MDVRTSESVKRVKERFHQTIKGVPPHQKQRWYFGGRLLPDRARIEDCKIPGNCVVQVGDFDDGGDDVNMMMTTTTAQLIIPLFCRSSYHISRLRARNQALKALHPLKTP